MEYPVVVSINLLNFLFLAMAFLAIYQYAYRLKMALQQSRNLQRESEAYRALFNTTWDGVFQLDPEGYFVFINQSGAAMLGIDNSQGLPTNRYKVFDFIPGIERDGVLVQTLIDQGSVKSEIVRLRRLGDRADRFIEITVSTRRRGEEGEIVGYGGIFRDVTARIQLDAELRQHREELETLVSQRTEALTQTNVQLAQEIEERTKAEEVIKKSLREKDLLLKEIHHRVKNNLQIIVSLINLQSRKVTNPEASCLFRDCQERIRAIALVHEKLYASDNLSEIQFSSYVQTLALRLYSAFKLNLGDIQLDVKVEDFSLGIDLAIPCGLIINELVSNAFKHAFPDPAQPEKKIGVWAAQLGNGGYELEVYDNGKGLPSDFDLKRVDSLGMKMIQLLVEDQLNGELIIRSDGGAHFVIRFKPLRPRPSLAVPAV